MLVWGFFYKYEFDELGILVYFDSWPNPLLTRKWGNCPGKKFNRPQKKSRHSDYLAYIYEICEQLRGKGYSGVWGFDILGPYPNSNIFTVETGSGCLVSSPRFWCARPNPPIQFQPWRWNWLQTCADPPKNSQISNRNSHICTWICSAIGTILVLNKKCGSDRWKKSNPNVATTAFLALEGAKCYDTE